MPTQSTSGSAPVVAFVASLEFIQALDEAAAELGCTRSHHARTVLTAHLRTSGRLAPEAPVTNHDARRRAQPARAAR